MVDVQTLMGVLQSFGKRRVLVLGEAILDRYLKGSATGICREAPVPVVGLQTVLEAPGGGCQCRRQHRGPGRPGAPRIVGRRG